MKMRQQRGFSMIEVLVAVLVLAIGLLGIAAMQTLSLRYVDNSEARTQVNLLAYELGELIRSDANDASNYATSKTSNCSAGKLKNWCDSLKRALPDAEFQVTWIAASRTADIDIWWKEREMFAKDEDGEAVAEKTSQISYQVRLPR